MVDRSDLTNYISLLVIISAILFSVVFSLVLSYFDLEVTLELFVLSYLFFVIGDTVTTMEGLKINGTVESNPIGRFIFDKVGIFWSSMILKNTLYVVHVILYVEFFVSSNIVFIKDYYYPTIMFSMGFAATINNSYIILTHKIRSN